VCVCVCVYVYMYIYVYIESEEVLCQCDMSEELSRQLEDILSTYCMGSSDGPTLPNGQLHSPELNGRSNEEDDGGKPRMGSQVNCSGGGSGGVGGGGVGGGVGGGGGGGGDGKEPKKTQEKKKVKGLGKESASWSRKMQSCHDTIVLQ